MVRSPKHVLVVDNDLDARLKLVGALRFEGYRVTEADSGAEALAVIESSDIPALVLLDLDLPGLDGVTVLRRITELPESRQPTVIVLAERSNRQTAVRAVSLGAVDFLEK